MSMSVLWNSFKFSSLDVSKCIKIEIITQYEPRCICEIFILMEMHITMITAENLPESIHFLKHLGIQ